MPLTALDKYKTKGKWITFLWLRSSDSGKTEVWEIFNTEQNLLLGYVEWNGRWRKYIFRPLSMTIYEETCLRDIAEFIESKTAAHRLTAKPK